MTECENEQTKIKMFSCKRNWSVNQSKSSRRCYKITKSIVMFLNISFRLKTDIQIIELHAFL